MPFCKSCGERAQPAATTCWSCGAAIGSVSPALPMKIAGVDGDLEVFDDYLTITPRGVLGFLNKGIKGSKRIPFTSITAVQHKKAGFTSGYLQFTLPGGVESQRGVFAAVKDENTFMYRPAVEAQVQEALAFIEAARRRPAATHVVAASGAASSVADELVKLASLRDRGLLTAEEFETQKGRLLK